MFLLKELEPSSQWRVCAGYTSRLLMKTDKRLFLMFSAAQLL